MLAGRDTELAALGERLDQLERGETPAQDLLFYGPRGNGKTTLLMESRRRAKDRGFRVVEFSVDALMARKTLVRELQERAGIWRGRRGHFRLGAPAWVESATLSENVTELLCAWLRSAPEPLVILLDEAHELVPGVARPFFHAVQSAKADSLRFLLVCAGTPDAPRQVHRAATHDERGFEQIGVGRLARHDSLTALAEPANQAGLPMAPDAARLLAEEGQDYPYFLQLLGDAAWRVAATEGNPAIGVTQARRGVDAIRPQIEDFHAERFAEASEHGVELVLEPLSALFLKRGGLLSDSALRDLLEECVERKSVSFDRIALLDTLRDLGIIWEAAPRVWEMGIPSFADHILHHAASP